MSDAVHAAIIARASTEHQGDTCEHQVLALEAWARQLSANRGERFLISPQHIFVDDGVSAWKESILERPAVKRFIRAVEQEEVRCLFIKGLSRFNRDDAEAKMFFEWLDGRGVRVKSLEEGFDSREKGGAMAIFHVHSFLAQLESDKKSISTRIGMREKMKKGQWKGGIPPYGLRYNPERKRLEPIETLRPVVADVFTLAAAGRGAAWIAHHFNASRKWAHLDPRTWTTTAVQRMLTRRAYVGDLVCGIHTYRYARTLERSKSGGFLFGKKRRTLEIAPPEEAIVVVDAHAAVISRELFAQVQAVLARRKLGARRPPNARHPLTGLLICGRCGGPMTHHGRNAARGYQYYTCANKLRKGKAVCDQANVRADRLHELVLLSIAEKLEQFQNSGEFWELFRPAERPTAPAGRRLAEVGAQIEAAADSLADLITSAALADSVRDVVISRTQQRIQQLQAEKVRLEEEAAAGHAELAQLQCEVAGGGLTLQPDTDTTVLREIFHKWVRRITWHPQKQVRIEWR